MQIRLVATPPDRAILINREDEFMCILGNRVSIRKRPYPPSLSRIAANTIDPAIGASTCAFGSHR
jgi:hypothetical protein